MEVQSGMEEGVTYLDGEHKGLRLNKGRKMDTHLRLVRRPSGPHRGNCEDAVEKWRGEPAPLTPVVPG